MNNLVGHGLGVAAAVFALWLTGGTHVHALGQVSQPLITWRRELAGALAVGLTTAGQVVFRAAHPPAAATTLLIALGAIAPEWRAIEIIRCGRSADGPAGTMHAPLVVETSARR